jgi:hypothetical protein
MSFELWVGLIVFCAVSYCIVNAIKAVVYNPVTQAAGKGLFNHFLK